MRSVGRIGGMKKSKENVDTTSGAVASVDKQACSCENDEPEKRYTYYVGGPLVSYSSSEEDEEIEASAYSTAVAATAVSAKTSRATATVTSASTADAMVDTVSSKDTGASLADLTGEPKANYTSYLAAFAAKLKDSAASLVEVTDESPRIPNATSANSDSTAAKAAPAAFFEDSAPFPAFNGEPGSYAVDNSESSTTSGASETPFEDSTTALAALAAYSDEFSDVSGDSAAAYPVCAATPAVSAASPAVAAATTCSPVSYREDGSGHI